MCFLPRVGFRRMSLRSPLHGGRQTSSERGRRNKAASTRTCLHGSRRHHQQARLPPCTPDRLGVRDESLAPVLPRLASPRAHDFPHLRARLVEGGSNVYARDCARSLERLSAASDGTTNRVAAVENASPPTTVIARGLCISPPAPSPTTSGARAASVASVVMRIGRILARAASSSAARRSSPRSSATSA